MEGKRIIREYYEQLHSKKKKREREREKLDEVDTLLETHIIKTDSKIIENLNRSITHKETEPTTAKTT